MKHILCRLLIRLLRANLTPETYAQFKGDFDALERAIEIEQCEFTISQRGIL